MRSALGRCTLKLCTIQKASFQGTKSSLFQLIGREPLGADQIDDGTYDGSCRHALSLDDIARMDFVECGVNPYAGEFREIAAAPRHC